MQPHWTAARARLRLTPMQGVGRAGHRKTEEAPPRESPVFRAVRQVVSATRAVGRALVPRADRVVHQSVEAMQQAAPWSQGKRAAQVFKLPAARAHPVQVPRGAQEEEASFWVVAGGQWLRSRLAGPASRRRIWGAQMNGLVVFPKADWYPWWLHSGLDRGLDPRDDALNSRNLAMTPHSIEARRTPRSPTSLPGQKQSQ